MKRLLLLLSLLGIGCNQDSSPQSPAQTASPTPPAPVAIHSNSVEGTVAERIDVEGYTYLRLSTGTGEMWAAVPTTPVKVGALVKLASPMPVEKFHSKSLNRTFDRILFANLAGPSSAPGAEESPRVVAKATGPDARTVAEVYRDRAGLKDKTVSVHGVVVKLSSGILGHNWIHLRDGSGSAASQDHDLVVTTTEDVKLEEEVTAQGTVHLDKDLGSGYRFTVLVEDAKITRP
ncbi:MAG: nucleotide-binding protein [Vulcanimicrobiota bacterium]